MRPLETLLVAANLAAFVLLVAPLRGRARPLHHAGLLPLPVTIAQLLLEGPRWQMVPAYALGGSFFLVWLLQTIQPAEGPARRAWLRRAAAGVGVALGVLMLAVSIALPTVLPVFQFPRPGGPYEIGTVTYHWVDAGRHEIFSTDPDVHRELMAQVWYPARGDTSSARAPYVQDAGALSSAEARQLHLPGFTFDYWGDIPTDAIPSAPVAGDRAGYPVLIFLSGVSGFRQSNTFQVEELVSHGYIVVGLDQPHAAAAVVFPDGREVTGTRDQLQPFIDQSLSPVADAPRLNGEALSDGVIPYLARDVSLTLDQLTALDSADPKSILTGKLDLQHTGVFGVSLGAIVAGEACHLDVRLRACLMMDAGMPADLVQAGLRQPSMFITRDAATMRLENRANGTWSEADIRQALTSMRAVFAKSQPGDSYFVQVPGMFHVNFTDAPSYTPLAAQLGFTGPIDPRRGHDIVNACSLGFFDRYLDGRPAALLAGLSRQYPEVHVEGR
jgi:predicted dienelactone hydrolase